MISPTSIRERKIEKIIQKEDQENEPKLRGKKIASKR